MLGYLILGEGSPPPPQYLALRGSGHGSELTYRDKGRVLPLPQNLAYWRINRLIFTYFGRSYQIFNICGWVLPPPPHTHLAPHLLA